MPPTRLQLQLLLLWKQLLLLLLLLMVNAGAPHPPPFLPRPSHGPASPGYSLSLPKDPPFGHLPGIHPRADLMQQQHQEYWQHSDGPPDYTGSGPRGPAEAAMEASMRAKRSERARLDSDLQQQALIDAALQREAREGRRTPPPNEQARLQVHMNAMAEGAYPFLGPYSRLSEPFGNALSSQDGQHGQHDLQPDYPIPAGHPLESLIEQQRVRGELGAVLSERQDGDRAADWRVGGLGNPHGIARHNEQSPLIGLQILRAAASQGAGQMRGLDAPVAMPGGFGPA